jgi:hypothetical protein
MDLGSLIRAVLLGPVETQWSEFRQSNSRGTDPSCILLSQARVQAISKIHLSAKLVLPPRSN